MKPVVASMTILADGSHVTYYKDDPPQPTDAYGMTIGCSPDWRAPDDWPEIASATAVGDMAPFNDPDISDEHMVAAVKLLVPWRPMSECPQLVRDILKATGRL